MSKPFSQACENNKAPILDLISQYFRDGMTVLEIGSYTAQHVLYFAENLPQIVWLPSDTPDNLAILEAGLAGSGLANIRSPFALDVSQQDWPLIKTEGIFSANTLHIMAEEYLNNFFQGVGKTLATGGHLCVYGPFKYEGEFTSESNAHFDRWLKDRDRVSGVRDFEKVIALARQEGMTLVTDRDMPSNNQCLVWQKIT